jgi:hypothetical protein
MSAEQSLSCAWRLTIQIFVDGHPFLQPGYSRNCQTSTATPAEPGELPWLSAWARRGRSRQRDGERIAAQHHKRDKPPDCALARGTACFRDSLTLNPGYGFCEFRSWPVGE